MQLKENYLRAFLFSLPGWFVIFKTVELGLLRSKEPVWFGLYSSTKFFAILLGLSLGFIWIRFVGVRLIKIFHGKRLNILLVKVAPTSIFLGTAFFLRLVTIEYPASVGEDIAPQILSTIQWLEGQTPCPNIAKTPSPSDFSSDQEAWIPRPPGASWIPLPGLLFGFSVGNSIQFTLFALALIGGLGWLKLAKTFGFLHWQAIFLALLLALPIGILSISLSTASVISGALFPWLIIWAQQVGLIWAEKREPAKSAIQTVAFFFCLGGIAWVKLSSLLTMAGIAATPFLFLAFAHKRTRLLQFGAMLSLGVIIFFIPYYLLSKTNENLTGYSSDQLYSRQDYNVQSELWGKHFSESTQGWMLVLSLSAGPGYALPFQPVVHRLRDLGSQFSSVRNFFLKSKINLPMFFVGIGSIGLSALLFYGLVRLSPNLSTFERSCYWGLFSIPFVGLAAVSLHHGFNYVLYPAYTYEFSAIFTLFSLRLLEVEKLKLFSGILLIIVCLAFPLYASGEKIVTLPPSSPTSGKPSATEKKRALGPSILSGAIEMAERNALSDKDVCFFLCEGNMGDYRLRTSMRSYSLHFASNNLPNSAGFKSSKPLNIFCIFESKLSKNQDFKKELVAKFPENTKWTQISNQVWQATLP